VLEKSSLKKKIPLLWLSVAVIFDSTFIKLCVCVIKSDFLSWAIRPVFTDSVTNSIHLLKYLDCDHTSSSKTVAEEKAQKIRDGLERSDVSKSFKFWVTKTRKFVLLNYPD